MSFAATQWFSCLSRKVELIGKSVSLFSRFVGIEPDLLWGLVRGSAKCYVGKKIF